MYIWHSVIWLTLLSNVIYKWDLSFDSGDERQSFAATYTHVLKKEAIAFQLHCYFLI